MSTKFTKHWRWALPVMLLGCLALPAAVGAQASLRDDVAGIRQRLDDLAYRLGGNRTVNRTEIRQELTALSDQLAAVEAQLDTPGWQGGYGRDRDRDGGRDWDRDRDRGRDWDRDRDYDTGVEREGWVPYSDATSSIQPAGARFDAWDRSRTFSAQTTRSKLSLTVNNVDYRATWTVGGNFSGSPKVTVTPKSSGDLQVLVRSANTTREFLISNGGLGPIFIRSGNAVVDDSYPTRGDATVRMTWVQPYYDQISAGQLSRSAAMDWFIRQVETGDYVIPELEVFGSYLRDIPAEVGGDIAILRYNSGAGTKTMVISDPRNSMSSFLQAINKAHAVYQSGGSVSIELR